jgi:hypothetical protein
MMLVAAKILLVCIAVAICVGLVVCIVGLIDMLGRK